jgi:hypothetical protein
MTAAAQAISIQLEGGSFRVAGWKSPSSPPPGGWDRIFRVYAGSGDVPPLAGTYLVVQDTLVFRPQFPIGAGVRYRAVFQPPGGATVERSFDGPARNTTPSTHVDRVYPSSDVLPSNQLRLYIYFSAPMSRGEAEQRIHVLDAAGKPLRGVFLPGQELWDPRNQRLTMTFDPGRIKRDLASNRAMGPPIAEGKPYTLLIDREWLDATGVPLTSSFRKTFRGGPAVRQPPDPGTWRIVAPSAGSRDPLVVAFPRPMNYTLLQRTLKIAGPHGQVGGAVAVARNESEWRFTPASPWSAGTHRLVIDTSLEDLAGNKIGQPFDIDVFDRVTEHLVTGTTSIAFEIAAQR